MWNKHKKKIIIGIAMSIIIILVLILFAFLSRNNILNKITQKPIEAQESGFKTSYKIVGIDDYYTYICVILEDEINGIKEVIRPDNFAIEVNNKPKIAIDYKVELEKDYIFTITKGNGEVINTTINVPIEKPTIIFKNADIDRFTIEVTNNYSKSIVQEYRYYVNGQLKNSGTTNKEYQVTGLSIGTTYDVYVEAYFKVDSIVLTSDTIKATTKDKKTLSTDITRRI